MFKKTLIASYMALQTTALFSQVVLRDDARVKAQTAWTIESGFAQPESAQYDADANVLYVSSINGQGTEKNGIGYISKVSLEGKILEEKFIEGLNAPKGLRIGNGNIWIADIDRLVGYRLKDKVKIADVTVEGAEFLNDIALSQDGTVYVSDMFTNKIHAYKDGILSVFAEGEHLEHPNGLLVRGPFLRVAAWGKGLSKQDFSTSSPGSLYNLNLQTKEKTSLFDEVGNLDGIESLGTEFKGFVLSDWVAGTVLVTSKNGVEVVVEGLQGAADLAFVESKNLVVVPEMNTGKLYAFTLSAK